MPFYERQPYIQPLHQIVKEVMQGDIRVPRFQRPGTETTWRPDQRGDLLDSLYRGFPVGTILLWSTTTPIRTVDVVGGFRIPPIPVGVGRPQRFLLDGHQRLSTLVKILGAGLLTELTKEGIPIGLANADDEDAASPSETWVFELKPESESASSRERFVLLKPDQRATHTQIPLDIVLNRSSLNRWVRDAKLTEAQEAAADSLRDRLREYTIPVAVLVADSLQEATESFKRVNSSGSAMSDFHMVTALAFDENNDPQQQFSEARAEYLAPIGWDGISDTDVLRVAAGLDEKKNPLKLDVTELAERIRSDRGLIQRAFQFVAAATEIVRGCGVHGPESLPYIWQLITLAVYLGRRSAQNPQTKLSESSMGAAKRWFWLTTYGEVFSGVNSAVVDRSMGALDDMLRGEGWSKMDRDMTRRVRPVTSFDFRTARARACALAMARYQDSGNTDGAAHRALTTGADAMQLLLARGRRSRWWELAIVTPEVSLAVLREALRRRERGDPPEPNDQSILERLGLIATDTGPLEDLLDARSKRLVEKERAFVVDELGLEWASTD